MQWHYSVKDPVVQWIAFFVNHIQDPTRRESAVLSDFLSVMPWMRQYQNVIWHVQKWSPLHECYCLWVTSQLLCSTMFCRNQLAVLQGIGGSWIRKGWYRYKVVRAGNRNANESVRDGGPEKGPKILWEIKRKHIIWGQKEVRISE